MPYSGCAGNESQLKKIIKAEETAHMKRYKLAMKMFKLYRQLNY